MRRWIMQVVLALGLATAASSVFAAAKYEGVHYEWVGGEPTEQTVGGEKVAKFTLKEGGQIGFACADKFPGAKQVWGHCAPKVADFYYADLNPEQREEITKAAKAMDRSVTRYLLEVHFALTARPGDTFAMPTEPWLAAGQAARQVIEQRQEATAPTRKAVAVSDDDERVASLHIAVAHFTDTVNTQLAEVEAKYRTFQGEANAGLEAVQQLKEEIKGLLTQIEQQPQAIVESPAQQQESVTADRGLLTFLDGAPDWLRTVIDILTLVAVLTGLGVLVVWLYRRMKRGSSTRNIGTARKRTGGGQSRGRPTSGRKRSKPTSEEPPKDPPGDPAT